MTPRKLTSYGDAIREATHYLLQKYPNFFVIGQGLWSPWYVGNTMKDLDKEFGKDRVMDTPVSEEATTGIAVGAGLAGYRTLVIHPRVDFMILASNQIVNQAAKWSHMLGGQAHPSVVIRGIVNRGGEQGAQHSQALHSWYSHIPGLRVVAPATPRDARDLLIAAVLSGDPVLYMDDRWLYDTTEELPPIVEAQLSHEGPKVLREGADLTLVGSSHSTLLCQQAAVELEKKGISAEVVDLRVLNPIDHTPIAQSVSKTGRLIAVDGSWSNCGMAGEVIAGVLERVPLPALRANPRRLTLPAAPAPTSKPLEMAYYVTVEDVVKASTDLVHSKASNLR